MPSIKLSDSDAKKILLGSFWSGRTDSLWPSPMGKGYWLRAQPVDGAAKGPRLQMVGADAYSTQPDGLWVFLWPEGPFADVVAIEVCGNMQNLNDKRSRYMPSTTAQQLHCTRRWLLSDFSWRSGSRLVRWQATGTWDENRPPTEDWVFPVRFLRVIYFVPDGQYASVAKNVIPHGHEFFSRHSSLNTPNAPQFREFLRRMTLDAHYYPMP